MVLKICQIRRTFAGWKIVQYYLSRDYFFVNSAGQTQSTDATP